MKLEIEFEYEKETKNTIRYMEKSKGGQPPAVGTLYVQKWALEGSPKKIRMSIEPAE